MIAAYADRIVVMHEGKIKMTGSPGEIFSQVSALADLGIRPPQVTEFAYELDRHGHPLSTYPVTLGQARPLVADWKARHDR